MARVIRVDKNGTKYWYDTKCPKCGGQGYIYGYDYIDGGRCWKCGGTGMFETTWKEYTPEYAEKLTQRRIKRKSKGAEERNQKFFHKEGYDTEGNTWIVLGDTYKIKDELKEAGARWSNLIGWHFDKDTEIYPVAKVNISELAEKDVYGDWQYTNYTATVDKVKAIKDQFVSPTEPSEWIGAIGDKIETKVRYDGFRTYETHITFYGETHYIYMFNHEGNILIWNTQSWQDLEEGKEYIIKGTIKDQTVYNGVKQTVLNRCKIKEVI